MTRKPSPVGFVYLIRCGDYYKIGFSDTPTRRVKDLQTANPVEVVLVATIPGTMKSESTWHRTFAHKKVRGEWFDLDKEEIGAFLRTPGCKTVDMQEFREAKHLSWEQRRMLLKDSKEQGKVVRRKERLQRDDDKRIAFREAIQSLTPADIEAARTPNGGWTKATLERWGVPWPPPRKWKKELEAAIAGPAKIAEKPPSVIKLAPNGRPHLTRDQIRGVACRKCGANAGVRCQQNGVTRMANHMIRMQDAQEQLAGSVIKNRLPV